MQMSYLYASAFLSKTFANSLNIQKQYEKNVWEEMNDAYSLLIRVQTTINHISICFFTTISTPVKETLFSERELKKVLGDTLTLAVVWTFLDNGLVIFDRFVLSMRMQVILDSLFARPGSAPTWCAEERRVQRLDYLLKERRSNGFK